MQRKLINLVINENKEKSEDFVHKERSFMYVQGNTK